jgi:replication-associated recombination protein RarA
MSLIDRQLSRVSLNSSGLHYLVIDEVDNLSKAAQQSLKSALDTRHAIFVLTTNHVSQLDRGMLDRCVLVEMNAASVSQLAPIARAVAAAGHVVLNDTDLRHLDTACNGSLRNVITNTARWARRQGQVSGQVAM